MKCKVYLFLQPATCVCTSRVTLRHTSVSSEDLEKGESDLELKFLGRSTLKLIDSFPPQSVHTVNFKPTPSHSRYSTKSQTFGALRLSLTPVLSFLTATNPIHQPAALQHHRKWLLRPCAQEPLANFIIARVYFDTYFLTLGKARAKNLRASVTIHYPNTSFEPSPASTTTLYIVTTGIRRGRLQENVFLT